MKHFIKIFILLSFFSCSSSNNETSVEEEFVFINDTSFSWLYQTSPMFKQDFRVFLEQIDTISFSKKNEFALNFLAKQEKIPLIESDTIVHFLYWGKADSVRVAGDVTGWVPNQKMKNIIGTKLWFATATYPASARIEYKIVADSTNWQLDSLNKQTVMGGMGENSELTLPAYEKPLFISKVDSVPQGNFFDEIIQSSFLTEERKVRVYLPPGYEKSTEHYPVIMFHDGIQFFDMTSSFNIFNNLIYQNKIQPFIAVFVEPVQRDEEYSGNLQENYTSFIAKELVPFMDSGFRTIPNAANRAQAGISNGGNIALWIVASQPETFNKIAALSSNVEDKINDEIEKSFSTDLKIYLLVGKFDLPILISRIQRLENTLAKTNCQVMISHYPEGHNWAFWQKYLPEALEYLFPPKEKQAEN